jgi:transmembrane sensor
MNVSEERMPDSVAREAVEWFVANRAGLDAAQQGHFADWIKRPGHAEEYLEIELLAQDLGEAADPEMDLAAFIERARADLDTDDNHSDSGAPLYPAESARASAVISIGEHIRRVPRAAPRFAWRYAAAAALVVAILPALWIRTHRAVPTPEQVTIAHFATRHAERLTQRLADGSVLQLNTDTAVTVRYSHAGRLIEMGRGQVMFEVAHEPTRPFRVIAGSAQVIDVGTTFDVYMQSHATLVTVVEGRVMVGLAPRGGVGSSPSDVTGGEPTQAASVQLIPVAAGQQVRVADGQLPLSVVQVDTELASAWLHGQIRFAQRPLAEVAAEFNRYSTTPIEIETPALRELRVSGVFATYDTDSFVAFLRSLKGVRVEVTPSRIRVTKK